MSEIGKYARAIAVVAVLVGGAACRGDSTSSQPESGAGSLPSGAEGGGTAPAASPVTEITLASQPTEFGQADFRYNEQDGRLVYTGNLFSTDVTTLQAECRGAEPYVEVSEGSWPDSDRAIPKHERNLADSGFCQDGKVDRSEAQELADNLKAPKLEIAVETTIDEVIKLPNFTIKAVHTTARGGVVSIIARHPDTGPVTIATMSCSDNGTSRLEGVVTPDAARFEKETGIDLNATSIQDTTSRRECGDGILTVKEAKDLATQIN